MTEIRIETVKVVGRHRRDLGDIESLAQSIEELNLIHPITITENGDLVAGQRRLEAFRLLGRDTIPARIVSDLTEAAERLRIERDENTERKEMTPEELVSVGRKLEELVRPQAKARQREGGARGAAVTNRQDQSGLPSIDGNPVEPGAHHGMTARIVAEAVGMKPTNYYRAKKVVEAASDPTLEPDAREVAQAALEEMNATGKMWTPYEKVSKIKKGITPDVTDAAATVDPPPPAKRGAPRKPLPDAFRLAVAHAMKAADSIHRLTQDDRWSKNAPKIDSISRDNLRRAARLLSVAADSLTEGEEL